jgi:hypothetical protein
MLSFMMISVLRRLLAYLRSSRFMTSIPSLEDGGRLATMAVELVDRFIIMLVVRRFHSMRVLLRCSKRSDKYVRMKEFVCRSTYTCIGNSCIAFPWFFIALWDIINFDML